MGELSSVMQNHDAGVAAFPGAARSRPASIRPVVETAALFELAQIDVDWDRDREILWTTMRHAGRPNFNPGLLADFRTLQAGVTASVRSSDLPVKYLVLGSGFPGVFNLGGDLAVFADAIQRRDRDGLLRYGRLCVEVLHSTFTAMDVPIVTIGLVEGDALGGGFEALLAFNVVVAEKGTRFGLPENIFGLFPGMGAQCLLSRKLGAAQAERMILSGAIYSAEELHDLGLVHVLAEKGQGEQAVRDYVQQNNRRHAGHCGMYRAARSVNPLTLAELTEVVEIWVDTALQLSDTNIKLMRRLAAAQARLTENATVAPAAEKRAGHGGL